MDKGKVSFISVFKEKGMLASNLEYITVTTEGIKEDYHKNEELRQVTLLSLNNRKIIQKINDSNINSICLNKFHENITYEGIDLSDLLVGSRIIIGDTIQEITKKGKKCFSDLGCNILENKTQCPLINDVIFTKIIKGGIIKKDDIIEIL